MLATKKSGQNCPIIPTVNPIFFQKKNGRIPLLFTTICGDPGCGRYNLPDLCFVHIIWEDFDGFFVYISGGARFLLRFFVAMDSMLWLEARGFPDSGLEGTQPNR